MYAERDELKAEVEKLTFERDAWRDCIDRLEREKTELRRELSRVEKQVPKRDKYGRFVRKG